MKTTPGPTWKQRSTGLVLLVVLLGHASTSSADPLIDSWFTTYSGRYARLYTTDAALNSGTTSTTWSRGSITQSSPAYSGVQSLYSSPNWIYLRTTGLGSHVMGPWYLGAARTQLFPNLPKNTKALYRLPRNPAIPVTRTLTGLGAIGYFVDGVAMFDGRDGFYWNGSSESSGPAGGIWNRDAYVNEGITFDPANAHQEMSGTYHYHANPIALRHLLNDHVSFNPTTKRYAEDATNLHHSPILGWVRDGFPVYGPYGYATATNAASSVRRMISGFVLRNGQDGTANLTTTGRVTLPAWAGRAYNRSTALATTEYGPAVSTSFPLGRYMEDKDYLGDLGKLQGVDFDLDEYNGRFCVTPEFPNGTYAYFVSITANGTPSFPYNIGRRFYGAPVGGSVASISETVTTNYVGGVNSSLVSESPVVSNGTVTLVWSSVEGGSYLVESSPDLSVWNSKANVTASGVRTQTNLNTAGPEFYRVTRSSIATYDP